VPHFVLLAEHLETRRSLFQNEDGDRSAIVGDPGPFAEDEDQIGDVAAGDERLAARHNDLVAVRGEARRHVGRIRAGTGFGDRQCRERSCGDARQQAPLLLLAAEIDERLHGVEIRRPDDAGRRASLGDLSDASEIHGIIEPSPAVALGDKDRVETERVDRTDIVPGEFTAAVVVLGTRRNLVASQCPHAVEDLRLLG